MNALASAVGASLALLLASAASAGPFEDGAAAEARGDVAAAVSAYRTAADAGQAPAQFALGRLYAAGKGVARDPALAGAWFHKAALQDNPGAEFALAAMIESGSLARPDSTRAAQWLLKAARHGYAPAEAELADRYARGDGVPEDLTQAIRWANGAAQQGDTNEQVKLGALYIARARLGPDGANGLNTRTFGQVMDHVFGRARWRETSGYRTRAQENALRAEGAMTVAAGTLSHHSMGTRDAPGAYDVVVASMSINQAASRLLHSGVKFRRVFAEGAHGPEGPHLHVEPALGVRLDPALLAGDAADGSDLAEDFHTPASDYQNAGYWLAVAAHHGNNEATRQLARFQAKARRE
jgi:TPR repeat protein